MRCWLGYPNIPAIVKILTYKVETKMPKIGPSGRVIPSLAKGNERKDTSAIFLS
jgi:hypothetical protein